MQKKKTKIATQDAHAFNRNQIEARSILEAIPDLVFVIDHDGIFLDYKADKGSPLLVSPEQFLGRSCKDVLPPFLARMTMQKVKQTLRTGKLQRSEYDLKIDDEKKYFEARYVKGSHNQVITIVRDITDSKHFEAQATMFRSLIDQSADMIFFIDVEDGSIVDVNDSACRALSYSKPELLQMRIMDIDQSLKKESDWLKRVKELRKGKSKKKGLHQRKDGSTYPIEANSRIVNYENRNLIIASCRDISAEIETNQKIKQLSRVVDHSPASIVITDVDGNIEYVNPAFCKLTGYSFEEALGKNPRILKSGELSASAYEQLWQTITAGEIWRGEFHNKKKDGQLYWEFASIAPVRNELGEITHFIAVKENITERKLLEQELKEKEEKYRTVADFTHDWEYWIDPNGDFLYISPSCQKISGYSADDFKEDKNLIFKIMHPDDESYIKYHFQRGIIAADDKSLEFRIIDKHGNEKWISHVCQPVYNSAGVWVGRRGSNRDITEQKRVEKELQKTETLKTVQELAGAVSHEFSQPLQSLSNYLGLLQQAPEKSEYLQKAEKSLQRIADLVRNLREITSLQKQDYLNTQILDIRSSAQNNEKSNKQKILVVDDEQEILDTMVEIIQLAGYDCEGAGDGYQALHLLKQKEYDLIISDISMPRMSGTDLFEKIKSIGTKCNFVFMTGYAVSDEIEKITKKADGLIHKPIDHQALIELIKKILKTA